MEPIKFIASQAHNINQYKSIKTKVLKCCMNIYSNQQCLTKKIVPNYANIKIPHTSPATQVTQKKVQIIRIKDEIKFMYRKKQKLKNDLYKIHLKAAQEWGNMRYTILVSSNDVVNGDLEKKYKSIDMKINKLEKKETQNQEFHEQFYPHVFNKTGISFSNDKLSLHSKGLKYNMSYKHKNWIETLALEAETAVSYLLTAKQDYVQYQVAHNIRQLYKQYNGNHDYNTLHMKRERHTLNKIKDKIWIDNAIISEADKGNTIVINYQDDYPRKYWILLATIT